MVYKSRSIKRHRHTKDEIKAIDDALVEETNAQNQTTIRHLFYRLVSKGLVEKTEAQYKHNLSAGDTA